MKTIRVGLVGLGHVGRAVARLFDRNAGAFRRRWGAQLELAWVCDRSPVLKLRGLRLKDRPRVTRHWRDLLADPALDAVIELIGGVGEAQELVLGALRSGKRVITANKHLLATRWDAVFAAARRGGGGVSFEAAVAGSVPVLQALSEGLAANEITRIVGILNGTTNYILTRMVHDGRTFPEALREAQAAGMAESDPTMDVQGYDAVHKVAILGSVVSGAWVRPGSVYREGIAGVALEDIRFAVDELGLTVRLLGILGFDWKGRLRVEARVHPALVPLDHPLAAVHGGYNAVLVQASAAKDLMFYGLGAGPEPAASAVLSDLIAAAQEILGRRSPLWPAQAGAGPVIVPHGEIESAFYLRLMAKDRPGVLAKVTGALAREAISIAQIHQRTSGRGWAVPVVITTHPVAWARMDRALAAIRRLPDVGRRVTSLRRL